ncbi:MAG TPA: AAA family ATPase [Solirubrobacteraceae bacterium]|nr:AAA family ATPase [Solirubrobacteraceae bacterium]
MAPRGLDTTGRPLDPEAHDEPAAGTRGFGSRDRGSPSFSDEFGGRVVRPADGERTGSAVAAVDFSAAVSDGLADVESVVRSSRVHAVLEEIDRDLIAMAPVKQRIREIAALLVIDRLRTEMSLNSQRPTLHMSFTGNPGTGKTTVALRMASILHRLGYIEKGHLVSVTRDDLVGQYVGHTAPKTKDVVKRALGGVLFIDEAYYLHRQENERDYGQEAVEVLLQVMESERQDLVVVMAGYGDRMEEFFQANPGMGSRVAHHIRFPDYDVDELLQIARLMVDRQGYEMSDDADRALREYIEARVLRPRFAHGRSIRNAIERARLRQATRLFQSHRKLTKRDLVTIEPDDILQSSVFDDTDEEPDGPRVPRTEAEASVGT